LTATNVSVETADEIARLATLLSHPLRVRLMTALGTVGSGSATTFSGQFGDVSVGDCHYHLKALRKGGVIDLVQSRAVRGATERVYRLTPRSRWRGAHHLRHLIDGRCD
jgi:DNA-binding transcriptional ArsR family regulator